MEYSVIMSIYYKVLPEYLKVSIDSVLSETLLPKKIILVKDGPLTEEQEKLLAFYLQRYKKMFDVITFEKNSGCGSAYNEALKRCKTAYAMIMDSDDYIVPTKNEKQMTYLIEHPECDLVGSNSYEFIGDLNSIVSYRVMPEQNEEILALAHRRCPIIQPSAMFKVKSVLESGSYQPSKLTEDYDLYLRMIEHGCTFYNIQEVFSYTRVDENFYNRRGGIKYLKPILGFKYKWYRRGFFTLKDFVISGGASLIVAVLPNRIRSIIYKKFLRKELTQCNQHN